jgi:hypothetical protein
MNYRKHYNRLILKSQVRTLDTCKYTEKHHIIPKCIGGSDECTNITVLLPEEHIVAHMLLSKIYPKNKKLIYAVFCMISGFNRCAVKVKNNKQYKHIKERYAKINGERMRKIFKKHNPFLNMSTEKRKNRSVKSSETTKLLGMKSGKNHHYYGKCRTEGDRRKIAENHADVSGKNNPRSKSWSIISPVGDIIGIEGTLKYFCEEHNISLSILKRNRGHIIKTTRYNTEICKNTIGWKLIEI